MRKLVKYAAATAVTGMYVGAVAQGYKNLGQERPPFDAEHLKKMGVATGLMVALTWAATAL